MPDWESAGTLSVFTNQHDIGSCVFVVLAIFFPLLLCFLECNRHSDYINGTMKSQEAVRNLLLLSKQRQIESVWRIRCKKLLTAEHHLKKKKYS